HRGDLRRPATLRHAGDVDDVAHGSPENLEPVAGPDLPRRLDPLPANLDVPREDELRRRGPRLREARSPEPLVEAHPVHGIILPKEGRPRRPAAPGANARTVRKSSCGLSVSVSTEAPCARACSATGYTIVLPSRRAPVMKSTHGPSPVPTNVCRVPAV